MIAKRNHKHALLGAFGMTLALGTMAPAASAADAITFVSWGGTTQEAQKNAWAEPFTEETGIRVIQDGPTNYGKLKSMVDSGNVNWDVVDVEGEFALRAAKQGLLEPLDYDVIDKEPLDKRFVSEHGVGSFFFSFVLAWNTNTYSDGGPQNWEDFFNVEEYPGKRMVYKWPTAGVLEMALLADGVEPDNLYPLDVDRAIDKLETIEDHLAFWGSGAESQQALASGEVAMCFCWNGRVFELLQDEAPVDYTWNDNLTHADFLVVPKGTENREEAMKFIAHAVSAEGQADFANRSAYTPINKKSDPMVDSEIRPHLSTAHPDEQVSMSLEYWAEEGPAISEKWNEFVLQ
ncbi:ABC transporter substrate-binding protein [Halofilum ochraceum]|uniref:ABC transporter substrate-binding protein n=1 Tax=Halofilum ochraceum TaxID=1611323 RepID=UPI000835E9BF|nr:ABC transporter substrate-binding protein [Halofilum ochraceum]